MEVAIETESQKRKRKFVGVAIYLIIVAIIITSVLVYAWIQHMEYYSSKDEPLPPQERWQILDANYYYTITGKTITTITLKYLGENTAQNVDLGAEYKTKYIFLYREYDLDGEFHKGDTRIFECDTYFETLSIWWDISSHTSEHLYATFDFQPTHQPTPLP